jgi:hypothetical protein
MPTALVESKFLFKWDLRNVDISLADISSAEFSFQGSQFNLSLEKEEGEVNFGCFLESIETLNRPGILHFQFDLVKRLDNSVTKSCQLQYELKELHRGWGERDLLDPATIREHTLKVKMWTSDYEFEYNMKNIDITNPSFLFRSFLSCGNKLRVLLKKKEGGEKYDILLKDVDSAISSKLYLQLDLFKRLDDTLVKSERCECLFNKTDVGQCLVDWFDVETIRDHIIKVKVLIYKPFSDFIEKPVDFENAGFLLFKKMSSNLSFLVEDEVVFVLRDILTSRCDYFRAMFEGSFKEAHTPVSLESKIPIQGIDVDVFKMIIEWIYTMDIKSLNNPISPSFLLDLQRVYVAADMYLLPDLCDSIRKYLNHLLTSQNFGDIFQVATRIGSESLEKDVLRSWISKSNSFNENDDQINTLIRDFEGVVVKVEEGLMEDDVGEELSDSTIIGIQRKMIAASSWEGESESKMSVVKCLASFLSVGTGTKKRKI